MLRRTPPHAPTDRRLAARATRRHRRALLATGVLVALVAVGCSKDDSSGSKGTTTSAPRTSTTTATRPEGPVADLTDEITGSKPAFIGAASASPLPDGYVEQEFVAHGEATSYKAKGELTADGRWSFEPDATAAYRTRVLVRRPKEAADASGTVIVEWLNVSGGVDANPDYASLEEEILRQGHTWVGVSAQRIGVEGGPVLVNAPGGAGIAGKGLKAIDPERYASLDHPGDGYSFDIYTQVARALRAGGPVLGGAEPEVVLAVGESQSAVALTTYFNGVQPLTKAFDGFLVHSRAAVSLPLVADGTVADLAGAMGQSKPTILRDDLDAPVLELQAESDVIGILSSIDARQPDTDTFRLWEVAGTSHADLHLVGPSTAAEMDCGAAINDGPMHLVAKASLRHLDTWVRTGEAPPEAPRLEVTADKPPKIKRDGDGIALGGVRTPPVDVPVVVLSGVPGPNPDVLCILLGSTTPLPPARIAERYQDRAAYQQQYEADVARVITAGFVLREDRDALVAYGEPSLVPE